MNRSITRSPLSSTVALAVGGLLLAAALTSFPARAGEAAEATALQVKYGDLDLNRPAGIETLYQRLQFAAHQVCGPRGGTGIRLIDRGWQTCVNSAMDDAVRQLNRPALTAYRRSHAGQSDPKRG
jgi:UrcA family protein